MATTCNRLTPQIELNTPELKLLALKSGGGNTSTATTTSTQDYVNAINSSKFISAFNYIDLSDAEYDSWWAEYYKSLPISTTIDQSSYLVKKGNSLLCVNKEPPPYKPPALPSPAPQSQPLNYKGYFVSKGIKYKTELFPSATDLYPYIPPTYEY